VNKHKTAFEAINPVFSNDRSRWLWTISRRRKWIGHVETGWAAARFHNIITPVCFIITNIVSTHDLLWRYHRKDRAEKAGIIKLRDRWWSVIPLESSPSLPVAREMKAAVELRIKTTSRGCHREGAVMKIKCLTGITDVTNSYTLDLTGITAQECAWVLILWSSLRRLDSYWSNECAAGLSQVVKPPVCAAGGKRSERTQILPITDTCGRIKAGG